MSVQLQEIGQEDSYAGSTLANALTENEMLEIPLSFAQERLWFLDQLHPRNPLYNVPLAVRIRGVLDFSALKRSIETILERHEILRTTYHVVNGTPTQRINDSSDLEMPMVDLSGLLAAERESELQRQLTQRARRPFDLTKDQMVSTALFHLGPNENVLFLNIHHIACDEWSMGIFSKELATFYSGFSKGHQATLCEPAVQYADFALWQRESVQSSVLQQQLAYWKKQLAGDLPVLELPMDYARPATQTFNGARIKRAFPKELSDVVKAWSRKENVTPFIFLLAAFKTLLHRYSGQEDIVIGTPIAGRNRVETEDLIGFFVNTLALRSRISGSLSFRDYLSQVREMTLAALSNQDVPFEKLVEEIHPDRNASQNPVFNVMFAVQNKGELTSIPGLELKGEEIDTRTAKFDVTLAIQDAPQGFTALLEFNTSLFDSGTVSRLLAHLEMLVGSIMANPSEKISRLQFLNPTERERILVDWNKTGTAFPKESPIHELFARQAAERPDDIAVVYGNDSVTYRELDERSNRVANYLKNFGVGPDVLVGICVERSIEMIVGWMGILKAGGAYVPLDPGYPAERLQFMLDDTQMPVLLTQKKLSGRLPATARKVCLDSDWNIIARESASMPAVSGLTSENIAYVIYTSGSTGKPKGVAVPHRAIARLVFNTNYIQIRPGDGIAQASNSSFDAATFEVWGALLLGGKLIGIPQHILLSPADMAKQLRQDRISAIFLTTALFNQIATDIPNAFCTVKNVLFGGEACDPRTVRQVLRHGPPERLLHVYGPTETTTFASWFEIKNVPEGAITIPIGRPLSNTTFFVLDKCMQPVPIGIPGELYIGGDALARGYHNRPELTAAKFVENPFNKNERLYRTGDLVRYLLDGSIEFLGRIDNQVKLRGFRIELEEIEIAIKQHRDIRDAVVVVRDEKSGKRLVAYVVPQMSALGGEEVRSFLKEKVPDFMVPTAFVFLNALPLTPNGKVDRRALPAPSDDTQKASECDIPRNNLENQLAKLWENILGVKPIGIYDNFFELGGHSLLAVRLFTQIEKKMGQKLPLSTLFLAPTIAGLANVMLHKAWSAPGASLVEIQPLGSRPPMFWLHTLGGGGGGGLFVYRKLAELLGPDQPSYGLVTPPEPFTSIEKMAAHYVSELKTIQPTGPYHIGGYCFGGVIAFEMARQLALKGEKVGLLALIDSLPPNVSSDSKWSLAMLAHFCRTLPVWLSAQLEKGPGDLANRLIARGRANLQKLIRLFNRKEQPRSDSESPMAQVRDRINEIIDFTHYPEHYKRYAEVHWMALDNYRPQVFPGRIKLFRTTRPRLLELDPEKTWDKLCTGGVDAQLVPATHEKILETPHVEVLAGNLRESLGIQPAPRLHPLEPLNKVVGKAA